MPEVISEHHDLFVTKFIQTGISKKVGNIFPSLMKDAEGFLVPISQKLSIFYHTKYGYLFVDQIRKS